METPPKGWHPFAWATDGVAFGVLTLQNAVDLMLTGVIALMGGVEAVPLSAWALRTMGIPGLIVVKVPFLVLAATAMLAFERMQNFFRGRYGHLLNLPPIPASAVLAPTIILYYYVNLNNIFVMFCIGNTMGVIP